MLYLLVHSGRMEMKGSHRIKVQSRLKETFQVTLSHIPTVLKIPKLDVLCKMSSHKSEWWNTDISPAAFALINAAHASVGLPCCDRLVNSPTHLPLQRCLFPSRIPTSTCVWQMCDSAFAFAEFPVVSAYL